MADFMTVGEECYNLDLVTTVCKGNNGAVTLQFTNGTSSRPIEGEAARRVWEKIRSPRDYKTGQHVVKSSA